VTPSAKKQSAPSSNKKPRAHSDPGQQQQPLQQQIPAALSPNRLRVRAPRPVVPDKDTLKKEKDAAIAALLEETHARRVAALAAAAAAAAAAATGTPAPLHLSSTPVKQ